MLLCIMCSRLVFAVLFFCLCLARKIGFFLYLEGINVIFLKKKDFFERFFYYGL